MLTILPFLVLAALLPSLCIQLLLSSLLLMQSDILLKKFIQIKRLALLPLAVRPILDPIAMV